MLQVDKRLTRGIDTANQPPAVTNAATLLTLVARFSGVRIRPAQTELNAVAELMLSCS